MSPSGFGQSQNMPWVFESSSKSHLTIGRSERAFVLESLVSRNDRLALGLNETAAKRSITIRRCSENCSDYLYILPLTLSKFAGFHLRRAYCKIQEPKLPSPFS
jgi:hypothetical protein